MAKLSSNEKRVTELLQGELKEEFPGCEIKIGKPLIYKVVIDESLEYHPKEPMNPKRGTYAFQTDILILRDSRPLVVIEMKNGGFSTHDVITYSNKAEKHKLIYPTLRYGFVVVNTDVITNKFFTHNTGFDFAVAVPDEKDFSKVIEVIKAQIKCAEILKDVLIDKNKTTLYSETIWRETADSD